MPRKGRLHFTGRHFQFRPTKQVQVWADSPIKKSVIRRMFSYVPKAYTKVGLMKQTFKKGERDERPANLSHPTFNPPSYSIRDLNPHWRIAEAA